MFGFVRAGVRLSALIKMLEKNFGGQIYEYGYNESDMVWSYFPCRSDKKHFSPITREEFNDLNDKLNALYSHLGLKRVTQAKREIIQQKKQKK